MSNKGRVKDKYTNRVKRLSYTKGEGNPLSYHVANFKKDDGTYKTYLIHRLVAEAFVENPNPEIYDCVNHIDGNKLNNIPGNLE